MSMFPLSIIRASWSLPETGSQTASGAMIIVVLLSLLVTLINHKSACVACGQYGVTIPLLNPIFTCKGILEGTKKLRTLAPNVIFSYT